MLSLPYLPTPPPPKKNDKTFLVARNVYFVCSISNIRASECVHPYYVFGETFTSIRFEFQIGSSVRAPHDFCPWRRRSIISLGWLTNVPLKIGAENRSPPTAFSAPNLIRNRRNKSARSFDCVYARPPFRKKKKRKKRKGTVALFNEG